MSGEILSAGTLFSKAKSFYKSSQYKQLNPKDCDQSEALAAIVFSALSIEAFLNELPVLANQRIEEDAQNLIREIQPLIVKRKKTVIKILKSSQCTSDAPLNTDVQSYKDVELLIDLRNTIVHLKAGDTLSGRLEDHKTILKRLQDTGVSIDTFTINPENSNDEFHFPFIALISTQAVAEWSCNVAANIINHLILGMRESAFKEFLKSYIDMFKPIHEVSEAELVKWHTMIFNNGCSNLDEFLEKIKNGQLVVTKSI
jgi:hypothetical protein